MGKNGERQKKSGQAYKTPTIVQTTLIALWYHIPVFCLVSFGTFKICCSWVYNQLSPTPTTTHPLPSYDPNPFIVHSIININSILAHFWYIYYLLLQLAMHSHAQCPYPLPLPWPHPNPSIVHTILIVFGDPVPIHFLLVHPQIQRGDTRLPIPPRAVVSQGQNFVSIYENQNFV